jgi:hypothetical protein
MNCHFCHKLLERTVDPLLLHFEVFVCNNCQPGIHVVHQKYLINLTKAIRTIVSFRLKIKDRTYEIQWYFYPELSFSAIREFTPSGNINNNLDRTFRFPLNWTPSNAHNKLKTLLTFL